MEASKNRFLTTHAGSLPRSDELVSLQTSHFRGESIATDALERVVEASTRSAIAQQAASGIDIGNNGEQARESFFTYVQHRMSGFAGESERPPMQDMVRYPSWIKLIAAAPNQPESA